MQRLRGGKLCLVGVSFLIVGSCAAPSDTSPPIWQHLYLHAETLPVLPQACATDTTPWAISLELHRDPLTGQVEWLSGHRYALTLLIEQLPVRLLILERPWNDTAFFPAPASETTPLWQERLREWLLGELLPFLAPYPQVSYIAFGRGWAQAPLTPQQWTLLLDTLRLQDSTRKWGLAAGTPHNLPALPAWDFLSIDYQHFYPKQEHPAYHAQWEATSKPLFLLYPNLFEPDKEAALHLRRNPWKRPPIALVAYQESDTLPCP